jgi:hypothetical protein
MNAHPEPTDSARVNRLAALQRDGFKLDDFHNQPYS